MLRASIISTLLILVCSFSSVLSQNKGVNREKYRINIGQTDKAVHVDGILDDGQWMNAERTEKFQRVTPTDTGFAIAQTEVMLTYDKSNLYIGIICHDPTKGKRPVESLRRDYSFMKNDNFMLFLNPYNDQTNGFACGISAAGTDLACSGRHQS
jgi:hypothetical protein